MFLIDIAGEKKMMEIRCSHCDTIFDGDIFPAGIEPEFSEGRNYCKACYSQETYIDAAQPVNPHRWRKGHVN